MKFTYCIAALATLVLCVVPATGQDWVGVTGTGEILGYDSVTGCVTGTVATLPIAGTDFIMGMARRPSDGAIFIAHGFPWTVWPTLYEVDPNTWTIVNQMPLGDGLMPLSLRGLAIDDAGVLWAIDFDGAYPHLMSFDLATGATLSRSDRINRRRFQSMQSLAWDSANQRLVSWVNDGQYGPGAGLVHIDPQTATVTDPTPSMAGGNSFNLLEVQGLGFDRDGRLISVGGWFTYEIDPETGDILWMGTCVNPIATGVEDIRPRT